MSDSSVLSANALKVDGLRIADELVMLVTFPNRSMNWIDFYVNAGLLVDLVIGGRLALRKVDPRQLKWPDRIHSSDAEVAGTPTSPPPSPWAQPHETPYFRLVLSDQSPLGDEVLDLVLAQVARMQGIDLSPGLRPWDLAWSILHINRMKPWQRLRKWTNRSVRRTIIPELMEREVLVTSDKAASMGIRLHEDIKLGAGERPLYIRPTVFNNMGERMRRTLSGADTSDRHTAAVLLLAHDAGLLRPGTPKSELIGPMVVDQNEMDKRMAELADLPSLAEVRILVQAARQIREEMCRVSVVTPAVAGQ